MKFKYVLERYLRCLLSGGEFSEGNEMGGLRETVDDRQNNGVIRGRRKPSNKVHIYMGPRTRRNREQPEQTSRRRIT